MNQELKLQESELKMFKEIANIFDKYQGQTRHFGLQLIHSHFPIKSGEILYETNNKEKRHLLIKPARKNKIGAKAYPTSWEINRKGKIKASVFCCDY